MSRFPSLVLLLALAAMLLVSTLAASPAHFHDNNPAGNCDLCAVGHLPAVHPAVIQFLAPALVRCAVQERPSTSSCIPFATPNLSRGPPAAPLV